VPSFPTFQKHLLCEDRTGALEGRPSAAKRTFTHTEHEDLLKQERPFSQQAHQASCIRSHRPFGRFSARPAA